MNYGIFAEKYLLIGYKTQKCSEKRKNAQQNAIMLSKKQKCSAKRNNTQQNATMLSKTE